MRPRDFSETLDKALNRLHVGETIEECRVITLTLAATPIPVIDTTYAVTYSEEHFTSGKAEADILFDGKVAQRATFPSKR